MKRYDTKSFMVGNLPFGGSDKVYIQSMCTTKTSNINDTINQILALEAVGCEIIRVSILDMEDACAIAKIKKAIHIPLVADIHFDYKLALKVIDEGIDKILKKIGEEATELVIAAKNPNPEEIKYELSDFLYHAMVLMVLRGVTWEDITKELAQR